MENDKLQLEPTVEPVKPKKRQKPLKTEHGRILIKHETDFHRQAFEVWYSLGRTSGKRRSYAEAARQLKVAHMSVVAWADSFHWKERAAARDEKIAAKVEEEAISIAVERKKETLELLAMAKQQFFKAIVSGDMNLTRASDMARLLQLENLILQEPVDPERKILVEITDIVKKQIQSETPATVEPTGETWVDPKE